MTVLESTTLKTIYTKKKKWIASLFNEIIQKETTPLINPHNKITRIANETQVKF